MASKRLYGGETAKAVGNFPISGEPVPAEVVKGQGRDSDAILLLVMSAVFAVITYVVMRLILGAKVWSGSFLVTDQWRKGAFGGWKLAERSLARLDPDNGIAASVAKLQLWKQS